jgi:hypothetical protein
MRSQQDLTPAASSTRHLRFRVYLGALNRLSTWNQGKFSPSLFFLLRFSVGFTASIHYNASYIPKQPEHKEKKADR